MEARQSCVDSGDAHPELLFGSRFTDHE